MSQKFGADTIKKLADLSRLELGETEIQLFTGQLGNVLEYIEKLNQLSTTSVEPMTHALELTTPFSEDAVVSSPGPHQMLESAPEALYDNYKVPQVIGGGN